jgi:uncharacterized membrane protein
MNFIFPALEKIKPNILTILLFAILLTWAGTLYQIANQFPSLFTPQVKQLVTNQWIVFAILILILILLVLTNYKKIDFLNENKNGILLSLIFFSIYFLFVSIFNQPAFDVDDIFFVADCFVLRRRF